MHFLNVYKKVKDSKVKFKMFLKIIGMHQVMTLARVCCYIHVVLLKKIHQTYTYFQNICMGD